jgi:predicted SprT family Zn-dependent metalloprotease
MSATAHFDWTGQRWGSLVATQYASKAQRKRTGARWIFRCDCGGEISLHIRRVRKAEHTTCGTCGSTPKPERKPAIVWPFPVSIDARGNVTRR